MFAAPVNDVEMGELHQVPLPQQAKSNNCCGRIFKDWSQPVILTVFALGAVGVGVGYGLNEPLYIAAAVALMAATILFSCGRITCLKPKKELENQLREYQALNIKLTTNILELTKVKDDLEDALDAAQQSVIDLNKTLKANATTLQTITDKLAETEKKLSVLMELYQKYKETTKAFAQDLNELKTTNKNVNDNVGKLGTGVFHLDKNEDELSDEIDQFNDVTKYQNEQNANLQKLLAGMSTDFQGMQSRFDLMHKALLELRDNVLKIDQSDDKFKTGASDFKTGTAELSTKILPKLTELIEQLTNEIDKLEADSSEGT